MGKYNDFFDRFFNSVYCFNSISIVYNCIIKSYKSFVKEEVPEQKPVASNVNANANTAAKVVVKEDNQEEVERLAVIISAISEEMREPVENFNIVSITEI